MLSLSLVFVFFFFTQITQEYDYSYLFISTRNPTARMLTRTLRNQVPPHNCERLEASECWAHQMVKRSKHSQKPGDRSLTTIQACCAEPRHCKEYIAQKQRPDKNMEFVDENTLVKGDLRNCMVDKRSNCEDATSYCVSLDMLPREETPVEVVTVKNKASLCCIVPTCANHADTWCAWEGLPVKIPLSTWYSSVKLENCNQTHSYHCILERVTRLFFVLLTDISLDCRRESFKRQILT